MMEENNEKVSQKNWLTALVLCWFFGLLGLHRFYAGKIGSAFLMIYGTVCALCILALDVYFGAIAFVVMGGIVVNDFVLILTKKFKDCRGVEITGEKLK